MHEKAKFYINKLQLEPHPEGGFFKEIYRSGEIYFADFIGSSNNKNRPFITSIYFLLEGKQVSKFHKLSSDEIWHFYDGTALKIYILKDDGNMQEIILGNDIEKGEKLQFVIKKDNWFAAEVLIKNSFSLVGCDVAPGFEFADFELAKRGELLNNHPEHKEIIIKFTD